MNEVRRTTSRDTRARRIARRARRAAADQRGHSLIAVMAIITSVLLIGTAIFTLGESEGDLVEYALDDARAFYVAEGGLERARAWLGDLKTDDPDANPVGMSFEDQTLGGGRYTIEVLDDVGAGWFEAYDVLCTGEIDGAVRQVRTIMVPETFARYQWFVERGGWRWFRTGERFEGPVHVNKKLQIDGDPWFGGKVTAGGGMTMKDGSDPTFEQGYELNVGEIELPDVSYLDDVLKAAALNGGEFATGLNPKKCFYHVELQGTDMTYTGLKPKGGGYQTVSGPTTIDISSLNGAVWFDDDIAIEGVLDGQVTIGSNGDINIWDDIIYDGSSPGNGLDPDCDDVLGMIADGHVIITYTTPNQNDCEIHGVMIALEKNLIAEKYQKFPPRGHIIICGGLIADKSIHLGQFENGECIHGYERDYRYDPRLVYMPPPYFPTTGRYVIYAWEEVTSPEA